MSRIREPPAPDNPLQSMPNVVMTSHIAGSVSTGLVRIGRYAAEEIGLFLAGKPALNPVTKEQLAHLA
jgi:phosphoglycerate dehydrogenase-like enzyme